MERKFFEVLIILTFLISLSLIVNFSLSLWSSPPPSQFNVTPDFLFVNWTNPSGIGPYTGNITLTNNFTTSIILNVTNTTSKIVNSTNIGANFSVIGFNGTHYIYSHQVNLTSSADSRNATLAFRISTLAPGRYNGTITIANASDATAGNITDLIVTLDVPINVNSTGIGLFSGNLTNSTLEIYYFNTSNITNVAGLRINLTDLGTNSLNLSLYDNSSNLQNSIIVNTTIPLTYTFPSFPVPSSYWHFTAVNSTTQDLITFNGSIELLKASLLVNTTDFPSGTFDPIPLDNLENITSKFNLDLNGTITTIFFINNTANYPITINLTNSTFLNNSKDPTKYMEFTFNLTNGTIPSNTANFTEAKIFVNITKTGDEEGLYATRISVDSDKGYPYKTFNLTLGVNLTRQLNTSVSDVKSVQYNDIFVDPGYNLTVNISVKYVNETNVTGLDIKNFTGSWTSLKLPDDKEYKYNLNISNISAIEISPALYRFNLTVPPNTPGGNYTLYVNATDRIGKNYGIGSYGVYNTSNALVVNVSGLWMSSDKYSLSFNKGQNDTFIIFVKNYGSREGSFDSSNPSITVSGPCQLLDTGSWTSTTITKWNFTNLVNRTVRVKGADAGSCKVFVNGSNTATSVWFRNLTIDVNVANVTEEGGLPPGYNITLPTYVANLAFTKADSFISVQQNSSNSTVVEVKNTGNVSQNITFSILNISSGWYSINATTASLAVNKTAGFLVTFAIGNEEIKDYSGSYKAESPNKTITSDFTLRVLPSEANKTYINNTLAAYKQNMTELSTQINQSKAQGYNVDLAEAKLLQLKTTIEQAENFIAQGDYFHAYQLLSSIKNLLDQTADELSIAQKAEEEKKVAEQIINYITYALIAAGIAGAIILAYLFWPTKPGYRPKEKTYVYKPSGKQEIWEKLKEKWAELGKKKKEEKKPEG